MLRHSAFMVNKKDYTKGFFLVLKVFEEEGACKNTKSISSSESKQAVAAPLEKSFDFEVMSSISKRKLKNEIIVTIALFLGIIFLVVVLTLAFKVYRGKVWHK